MAFMVVGYIAGVLFIPQIMTQRTALCVSLLRDDPVLRLERLHQAPMASASGKLMLARGRLAGLAITALLATCCSGGADARVLADASGHLFRLDAGGVTYALGVDKDQRLRPLY